jgi:hypothetical protein
MRSVVATGAMVNAARLRSAQTTSGRAYTRGVHAARAAGATAFMTIHKAGMRSAGLS